MNDEERRRRKAETMRRIRAANPEKSREANRRWYAKNREKVKEWRRNWRKAHPHAHVKRMYGITVGEFNQLLESQKNSCLICEIDYASGVQICLDHCHQSGKVRGVLCKRCNTLLGLAKDSEKILSRAIRYLAGQLVNQNIKQKEEVNG